MNLFIYELKKMLKNKFIIILILMIFFVCAMPTIYNVYKYINVNESYYQKDISEIIADNKILYNQLNIYLPYSEENFFKYFNDYPYIEYDISPVDSAYIDSSFIVLTGVMSADNYRFNGNYIYKNGLYQIVELNERNNEILSIKSINTALEKEPLNKKLLLQQKLMSEIGTQIITYSPFWSYWEEIQPYSTIIIMAVMVFIISPVFANEFTSNMYIINSSTSYGKRKILICKVSTCIFVVLSTILLFNIIMYIICIIGGNPIGFDTPLNSFMQINRKNGTANLLYTYTPYDINIFQYFIIRFFIQSLTSVAIIMLSVFISLLSKSVLFTICVSETFIFSGLGIEYVNNNYKTLLSDFSLTNGLMTYKLFYRFKAFEILGKIILYPYVYIVFLLLLILMFFILSYIYYVSRKCNEIK